MIRPFVIFGMPRSRTAWLSRFLTYGDWACGHEELRHMRSMDDVKAWLAQPCTGTAETAAAPFWRSLPQGVQVVVVRRPVGEVVESLMRLPGCSFDRAKLIEGMTKLDRKLGQIAARVDGAISVTFDELAQEQVCARIFEACLPYKHDHDHWAGLASVNVQADMRAMMRYFQAYRPALDKLAAIAKHQSLASMAINKAVDVEGVTFQTEDFDTWVKDARSLFDDHLIKVGEAPGDWERKNIPLMRRIYDADAMQITTARSNGRMFGYLMTLISPSLASEQGISAVHTTFFASSDIPGLGLKLQRASLETLRKRGVNDVFMRAGVRGSGDRLDTIYRRLGAENNGREYRLVLEGM